MTGDYINQDYIKYINCNYGTGLYTTSYGGNCNITLVLRSNLEFQDLERKVRELEVKISTLSEKLCILNEDPAKLEKYESLKNSYEQHKIIERIVYGENNKSSE